MSLWTRTQIKAPRSSIKPLNPNISIHILHTVFYTFPTVLKMRKCLTIKSFLVGDYFLCSRDSNVWGRGEYCKEKLVASHSWGSKD